MCVKQGQYLVAHRHSAHQHAPPHCRKPPLRQLMQSVRHLLLERCNKHSSGKPSLSAAPSRVLPGAERHCAA